MFKSILHSYLPLSPLPIAAIGFSRNHQSVEGMHLLSSRATYFAYRSGDTNRVGSRILKSYIKRSTIQGPTGLNSLTWIVGAPSNPQGGLSQASSNLFPMQPSIFRRRTLLQKYNTRVDPLVTHAVIVRSSATS
jgi:hypothetical protein